MIDAADSFAVSYILSDACHAAAKPLVSASVIGMTGYAGAFCGGGPSYRAVFPDVSVDGGTCASVGVLGTAVAVLGSLQAHLALHLLLGLEPSVLGRVVTFDARRLAFGGFGFAGTPEPETAVPFIAPAAVTADDLVVDLRSLDEAPQSPFAGARRIDVEGIDALVGQPMPPGTHCALLPKRPARPCGRRPAARTGGGRPGAGGSGLAHPEVTMTLHTTDKSVLNHIERLVTEEKKLYAKSEMSDAQRTRLTTINVELDHCWDLLRQRRALREFGRDPDEAEVRPAKVVENYKG